MVLGANHKLNYRYINTLYDTTYQNEATDSGLIYYSMYSYFELAENLTALHDPLFITVT